MKPIVPIFTAFALVPVLAFALSTKNERDLSGSGALSLEQLRQEPIAFELDVPCADTGNPRHRLGIYLPKKPKGGKVPVIVFFHGGGLMEGGKSDAGEKSSCN
jgi:acetyl esterase/lipase